MGATGDRAGWRRAGWAGWLVGAMVMASVALGIPSGAAVAATTVHTGTLDGETHPFDDYPLNLHPGDVLTVDMVCDPSTPLDPALQLLGPAMTVVASDDDGGSVVCQQSRSSRLVFTVVTPGRYTIRASSYEIVFDNDPTDNNADGDYTLTIDAPTHSTGFTVTGSLEGVTNPFDDYQVSAVTGDVLTVDMVCDPSTPLDPALQLLGPAMNVLVQDDDGGTVSCQQSRSSRLSFTVPTSGIYTIRASSYEIVFDNDPTDDNADGDYMLTVSAGVLATPLITSVDSVTVVAGAPLAHTFTATGVPTPTIAYANEQLPPGVTRTGDALSGAPTAAGTFTIDVTAANGIVPNATQTFTITVTGTAPTITSSGTIALEVGMSLAHTFTATGNPAPTISYANEVLPPGVSRTGDALAGTPTSAGVFTIDITATNGVDPAATQTLTITVSPPATTTTSSTTIPETSTSTPETTTTIPSGDSTTSDPAAPTTVTGETTTTADPAASTTSAAGAVATAAPDPTTTLGAAATITTPPLVASSGTLPATGTPATDVLRLAVLALITGLAVVAMVRRRAA